MYPTTCGYMVYTGHRERTEDEKRRGREAREGNLNNCEVTGVDQHILDDAPNECVAHHFFLIFMRSV